MKIDIQDVSELIQSMTRNEKGYFKKYSAGFANAKSTHYLKLFNLLQTNPTIASRDLNDFLRKKKIRIHISSAKAHLYELLTKSLLSYHRKSSIMGRLSEKLDLLELLGNKGLLRQARKNAASVEEVIEKEQLLAKKIVLLQERRNLLRFFDEADKEKIAREIHEQMVHTARQLIRQDEVSFIYSRSNRLLNKYYPIRNEAVRKEALSLLEQLNAIEHDCPSTFVAMNALHAAYSCLYRLLGNFEASLVHQEKTISIYRTIDPVRLSNSVGYISALFNRISNYLRHGSFDRAKELIDELMEEIIRHRIEHPIKWDIYYALCLDYILLSGRMNEGPELISKIEDYVSKHKNIQNLQLEMAYNLATYHFLKKTPAASLGWLNFILNSRYKHSQFSFTLHTKLLNILVHYELDNILVLPSLIRNTFRFMMKHELEYRFEREVLNFFRRLMNAVEREQLLKMFLQLQIRMKEILSDSAEQLALSTYFNYMQWLEEMIVKLEGRKA